MIDAVSSPIFAILVTVALAILPWAISRFRTRWISNSRKLDSPAAAWARAERISKLSSSIDDPIVQDALQGALFEAFRVTTYRQVRRPWRRLLVVAIIYVLLGAILSLAQILSIFGSGKIGAGEAFSLLLGISVCLMSIVWVNSATTAVYRNVIYRNRIDLLIARRDRRFLRDPARTVWLFGAASTVDQAFDALWVRVGLTVIRNKSAQAQKLHKTISSELLQTKQALAASELNDVSEVSARLDKIETRIDSWFNAQIAHNRPIGPRLNFRRLAKSVTARGPIYSIRGVRGAL